MPLRHGWSSCDYVSKKAYSGSGGHPERWTPKEKHHDGQEEMDLAFFGNVALALLKEDIAVTRPLHTSCFGEVHLIHTNSTWDFPEVLEDGTSEMSSGSMSPDLGDTWHQGFPMSPQ